MMPSTFSRLAVCLAVAGLVACSETATPTGETTGAELHPSFTPGSGAVLTPLAAGISDPFRVRNNTLGHRVFFDSPSPSLIGASMADFAPGGTSGWHTHAGPVFVVVISGVLTSYDSNCDKHVFPAGSAFVESGGEKDVHTARNEEDVPLQFLAMQVRGVNAPSRIDAEQPANCAH